MKNPTNNNWQERFDLEFKFKLNNGDYVNVQAFIQQTIDQATQEAVEAERARLESLIPEKITGETSDGYHTFNELYEFRKLFNAHLFNEWYSQGKYEVHKSTRHSDGEECFGGGWFIVMATLPTGQISNHYEMKDWGLFNCQVRQRADKWDGHTAKDVAKRLYESIMQEAVKEK